MINWPQSDLGIKRIISHKGPVVRDERPLIDQVHEVTFNGERGLEGYRDLYALRMLLRKAHCFTLDAATSSLVADFSLAIAPDLESARRLALPPFPVTWIELDNAARLKRVRELGIALTENALGSESGPPVERCGWLIQPGEDYGVYATYFGGLDNLGIVASPMSYWWHTGEARTIGRSDLARRMIGEVTSREQTAVRAAIFGIRDANVNVFDAYPSVTPLHNDLKPGDAMVVTELMNELAGELRHIWGFLIALGAGQLGVESKTSEQPKPQGPPKIMKNGKPLLPLEHKVLHLHLRKKLTVAKVVLRAITDHHRREHDVRGHFRVLKRDGVVYKRVPVKSHTRGDKRLGRIDKTYQVER